jgi:hypothetical protein
MRSLSVPSSRLSTLWKLRLRRTWRKIAFSSRMLMWYSVPLTRMAGTCSSSAPPSGCSQKTYASLRSMYELSSFTLTTPVVLKSHPTLTIW